MGLGAAAVFLLPEPLRILAWSAIAMTLAAITIWGVVSMRSGIFGPALTRGDPRGLLVALTYDDGPDAATGPLLDVLRARRVSVAFFVIGSKARAHPDLVRRCQAEGHLIANHTDVHSNFTNFFSGRRLRRDLEACQQTVTSLVGEPPRFFRPPVGLMNHVVHPVSCKLGLELVGWRVRSGDTSHRTPAAVAGHVMRHIRGGDIILLHDGGQAPERVREITERILNGLEKKGLKPTRLDRLVTQL